MSLLPWLAMSRNTRSASAASGTFSTKLVAILSPNCCLERLAGVVVGERPAAVADRADVGEGDLERRARRRRGAGPAAASAAALAAERRALPWWSSFPPCCSRRASRRRPPRRRWRRARKSMGSWATPSCGELDYPGKNGLPIDAGMLTRMNAALREIRTRTRIVARYGSMVRNWLEICTPSPCSCSCSIVTPPNR